jgi:hypothetical protein
MSSANTLPDAPGPNAVGCPFEGNCRDSAFTASGTRLKTGVRRPDALETVTALLFTGSGFHDKFS